MSRTPSAIAYLVTAHAEPLQLRRLVQSLAAPWASFFVHIDRKTAIEPFAKALVGVAPVTFVRRRVRVYWGGWSQVEATLRLMQCAMTKDRTLARFALISGACYPLKSNETLRDYLLCDAREHISAFPMPDDSRDKPLTRLTRWHLQRGPWPLRCGPSGDEPGNAERVARLPATVSARHCSDAAPQQPLTAANKDARAADGT